MRPGLLAAEPGDRRVDRPDLALIFHPLVVMASLTNHYNRMLALDGADVRGEKEAAELLGLKGSTFPARDARSCCA